MISHEVGGGREGLFLKREKKLKMSMRFKRKRRKTPPLTPEHEQCREESVRKSRNGSSAEEKWSR